ncbi:MAG: hydrogenase formation protein HypD [Candidatus Omnitrophota bacterium]
MLYEKSLRNKKYIKEIVSKIDSLGIKRRVPVMEVCGTHTYSFFRFGLAKVFAPYIDLISGPGCPVCITPASYIDQAVRLAKDKKNIIATFGDLLRVPGKEASLDQSRSQGKDIRMVYSPQDSLTLAKGNKTKRVIFLSVGFETTAPLVALTLREAKKDKVKNFYILCGNRRIPPAMVEVCKDKEIGLEGFLCPGHVSAIIGVEPYCKIVKKFHKGCVVAGFEPLDLALGLYKLLVQISRGVAKAENAYTRVVRQDGNKIAQKALREVFTTDKALWRGLGYIAKSGYFLNEEYERFSASQFLDSSPREEKTQTGCMCGEVIKGKIKPFSCRQFRIRCSPSNPLGPCMVSFEGTCRIYYEYRNASDKI